MPWSSASSYRWNWHRPLCQPSPPWRAPHHISGDPTRQQTGHQHDATQQQQHHPVTFTSLSPLSPHSISRQHPTQSISQTGRLSKSQTDQAIQAVGMWRCIPLRRDMAYTSIVSGPVLDHATSGVFDIEISRSLTHHHRVGLGSATAKLCHRWALRVLASHRGPRAAQKLGKLVRHEALCWAGDT